MLLDQNNAKKYLQKEEMFFTFKDPASSNLPLSSCCVLYTVLICLHKRFQVFDETFLGRRAPAVTSSAAPSLLLNNPIMLYMNLPFVTEMNGRWQPPHQPVTLGAAERIIGAMKAMKEQASGVLFFKEGIGQRRTV